MPTNWDRITAARATIRKYCEIKEGTSELYDEAEDVLSDLLADLLHWCKANGHTINIGTCAKRAEWHFEVEA